MNQNERYGGNSCFGAKAGVSKDDGSASSASLVSAMLLQVAQPSLGFQTVASTKQATAAGYKASASGEGANRFRC